MSRSRCFFVMPFRPELNFFYLYLAKYLNEAHNLEVSRGDSDILDKPLMEKIAAQIAAADVIIADITGGNPNVFFELGLAHAAGMPIIFLTQEAPERVPVDVRQFEHITYNFARDRELLEKLDNALKNVFLARYKRLYDQAVAILKEFRKATGMKCAAVGLDEFRAKVIKAERTDDYPDEENLQDLYAFLLPRIGDTADIPTLKRMSDWLAERFPPQD